MLPSHEHVKISIKMDSIESRFGIGPSNILFGVVYVCTFQPGNFTGCGSEGVNSVVMAVVGGLFGLYRSERGRAIPQVFPLPPFSPSLVSHRFC